MTRSTRRMCLFRLKLQVPVRSSQQLMSSMNSLLLNPGSCRVHFQVALNYSNSQGPKKITRTDTILSSPSTEQAAKKQKLRQSTLSFSGSLPLASTSSSPRLVCSGCQKSLYNPQGLGSHRQQCPGPVPEIPPPPWSKPAHYRKGADTRKR